MVFFPKSGYMCTTNAQHRLCTCGDVITYKIMENHTGHVYHIWSIIGIA